MKRNSAAAACLLAAATVASSGQLPLSLTNQCDRTIRFGVYRVATPIAVLGPSSDLNFDGACVAYYNQPWSTTPLARVEAGDLDLAYADSTAVNAAANRGPKIVALSSPLTLLENCALVARRDIQLPADLRHRTIWTIEGSDWHYLLLGTLQSAFVDVSMHGAQGRGARKQAARGFEFQAPATPRYINLAFASSRTDVSIYYSKRVSWRLNSKTERPATEIRRAEAATAIKAVVATLAAIRTTTLQLRNAEADVHAASLQQPAAITN